MKANDRLFELLAKTLFVFFMIMFLFILILAATPLWASDYKKCCSNTYVTEVTEVTNVTEQYTTNETYEDNFSDASIARGMSLNVALANLPENSHYAGDHGHTGVSVAVGSYRSYQSFAVGLNHQIDQFAFKISGGISGSERVVGAGANFTF